MTAPQLSLDLPKLRMEVVKTEGLKRQPLRSDSVFPSMLKSKHSTPSNEYVQMICNGTGFGICVLRDVVCWGLLSGRRDEGIEITRACGLRAGPCAFGGALNPKP